MTTPEWTAVDRELRSRLIGRHCIVAVLVALGVLGGIGLGIPIGRDQQLRVDAQRTGDTRQWQDEQPTDVVAPPDWTSPEDGGDQATAALPPLPDVAALSAAAQGAFNRFHCTAGGPPSPQCAALAVLQADSRFEPGSASAPALLSGSANGAYAKGQHLVMAAKASSDFDGYLYVDYYDSDGNVVHLQASPYSQGIALKRDAWVQIGQAKGEQYLVYPPFGTDLVVAISTPLPLFEGGRPAAEPAARYLAALHERLQRLARDNPGVAALSSYTAVVTSPSANTNL